MAADPRDVRPGAGADEARRRELADFLRGRRDRLTPERAGLPSGRRRRTPGLRREEVAQLVGVSTDWYTRLEQGRPIQVSLQVLESLSNALRLDPIERRHLLVLASPQPLLPHAEPSPVGSPTLQRYLDRQGAAPACVMDSRLTIVAWNRSACSVFGDYARMSERERNSVWRAFRSPELRELKREGWEAHARMRLAQFRAGYAQFAGDPWRTGMIEELTRESFEFRAWWAEHDVLNAPEGRKLIYHPEAGPLAFEHLSFESVDVPGLQVMINMPLPDFDTETKISRLLERENEFMGR
ncbi:helix-turn-helix domain-containing protein [Cohnella sp. CBP 2801]|uniref:Helix-turn-helix domain-containing protein n=1 Tax=Cohnella zeiphila TaxID=2761120 RepID=A0A7X0SNG4_9BACL|nr:helix-turn-helix domain-containing protein [Cohnella zeiphila]